MCFSLFNCLHLVIVMPAVTPFLSESGANLKLLALINYLANLPSQHNFKEISGRHILCLCVCYMRDNCINDREQKTDYTMCVRVRTCGSVTPVAGPISRNYTQIALPQTVAAEQR